MEREREGCRLQVAGCRLQVAGYRLHVTGCRLNVTGCRLQVAGCRLNPPFAHFSDEWLPDAIRNVTNNDLAARTPPFYGIRKPCMKTSEPRVEG